MKKNSNSSILYGTDLFSPSKRKQAVEFVGFLNNDNVKTLEISDFYYSSFQYGKYNYLLYEKDAESEFPIASMFSTDISELSFLQSSAKFENKPYFFENDNVKVLECVVNDDKEVEIQDNDKLNLFNKLSLESKVEFLGSFIKIYVSNTEKMISVFVNSENIRQISEVLYSFFNLKSSELKVVKDKDMQEVEQKYFISLLRACIIAVKASLKYKCDVLYKFSPFYITGDWEIEEHLVLKKSDTSVISSTISINYDMGSSDLFEDKIMESIKKITSNFLPPHKRKINITLSHKKSYNSCATYSDCASIILAFTSRTLVKIANSFGIPIHNFLDNIIEHYSQETEINPESIEAKNKIFELSNYAFKYSIYSHNLLLNSELSTISRQSKKHILLIPVFVERNIFLAIIEYNNATREILNIYMTLPKFNIEDEKGKILSTISQFFSKGAYVFSSDFTQKNIVIVDFELQEGSQVDSDEICQAFLLSFSMGNVVV